MRDIAKKSHSSSGLRVIVTKAMSPGLNKQNGKSRQIDLRVEKKSLSGLECELGQYGERVIVPSWLTLH